jgi:mercuric reductase
VHSLQLRHQRRPPACPLSDVRRQHLGANEAEPVSREFDLIVIGAGSAAREAAFRARAYGASVAIVERGLWGGSCPNVACAPTKAYLVAAELVHDVNALAPELGIDVSPARAVLARVRERKRALTRTQERWLEVFEAEGIAAVHGEARFADAHTVTVGETRLTAERILIATGSRTAVPPVPGLDAVEWLDHVSALELEELPESLVVVGAGPVGLELGQAFSRFGSRVTIVDVVDRVAPRADAESSAALAAALAEEGIELLLGASIDSFARTAQGVVARVDGRELQAERVLLAAGRRPNVEGLDLDAIGVETTRAGVVVDRFLRTGVDGIWAAGDVTGLPQLSPLADYQGRLAADDMFGVAEPTDFTLVPTAVFTDPELAAVGLTEEEARSSGLDVETASYPLGIVQRAFYIDAVNGLFKVVYERGSRRVVGLHVVCRGAGDIVNGYTLALKLGVTVDEIAAAHNAFPTFSEGVKYAAQRALAPAAVG